MDSLSGGGSCVATTRPAGGRGIAGMAGMLAGRVVETRNVPREPATTFMVVPELPIAVSAPPDVGIEDAAVAAALARAVRMGPNIMASMTA